MKYNLLITLIFLINQLDAFGESGAIFLVISPLVVSNGMGSNGVCNTSESEFGAYFNPANNYYPNNGTVVNTSFANFNWLTNLAPDIYIRHFSTRYGVHYSNRLQFSFGYDLIYFNLGKQFQTSYNGNEQNIGFTPYMASNAFNFGTSIRNLNLFIPIDVKIGATIKNAYQNLGRVTSSVSEQSESGNWWDVDVKNLEGGVSSNLLYDYGILIETNMLDNKFKLNGNEFRFFNKVSYGYSISNLGDFISFGIDYKSSPTPRFVRAGIGLNFILLSKNNKLLSWNIIHAVEDMLIRVNDYGEMYYERGMGDIKFIDHIIFNYPSKLVTVNKGQELAYKDIISFRIGHKNDLDGGLEYSTLGMSLNATHYLKKVIKLNKHENKLKSTSFSLKLHFAYYMGGQGHPLTNTMFYSSSLLISNLN